MNTEVTGGIPVTVIKTAMFSPILPYYAIRVIIDIIRFWETAHLPPPPPPPSRKPTSTLTSHSSKCWLRGGVGGQFPRNV